MKLRIADAIEFSFVRGQARHLYGTRGNVSIDPVICLKLTFLLSKPGIFATSTWPHTARLACRWQKPHTDTSGNTFTAATA